MWYKSHPQCAKTNDKQCPIDIHTALAVEKSFRPFLIVPNALHKMKIENTGHSVQMSYVDSAEAPIISGGPLIHSCKFAQLHFHWHSETRINNKM